MKIRTDFVTNSSSSSFILARKPELTKEQEKLILDFVKEEMLGHLVATTKEELDKHFERYYDQDINSEEFKNCYLYEFYQKSLEAINNGLAIYRGSVILEGGDNSVDILRYFWRRFENVDKDSFKKIDTSLNY